jgi:2,4-dienoyl-CoA reductase-like NADH-dependent reductase (Old Yellow Enzyme family)
VRLLEPFALGTLSVPNRVVMAPMTRNRSPGGTVTPWAVEHYAARASAGLLITESVNVSARGQSTPDTPGLYTRAQAEAWRAVTDAVHHRDGRIVAQLAHAGRLTHSDYHGQVPVAPSALAPGGFIRTPKGTRTYEVPEVPDEAGVRTLVNEFAASARWAVDAGFDGVELHGAHGFLIDQFLQSRTNLRTDGYGGDRAGRRRFLIETVAAVAELWPWDRVGVTLSPGGNHKGIGDDDPRTTFTELVQALAGRVGWVHCADIPVADQRPSEWLKPAFRGPVIVSEGYTQEAAEEALAAGHADLVAFGRAFTANPDLVEKFRTGAPLAHADSRTFYTGGRDGYLDFP